MAVFFYEAKFIINAFQNCEPHPTEMFSTSVSISVVMVRLVPSACIEYLIKLPAV